MEASFCSQPCSAWSTRQWYRANGHKPARFPNPRHYRASKLSQRVGRISRRRAKIILSPFLPDGDRRCPALTAALWASKSLAFSVVWAPLGNSPDLVGQAHGAPDDRDQESDQRAAPLDHGRIGPVPISLEPVGVGSERDAQPMTGRMRGFVTGVAHAADLAAPRLEINPCRGNIINNYR
jgi:hypothetical protein